MRTKLRTKRILILSTLISAAVITSLVVVFAQSTPPSASGVGQNDTQNILLTFSATSHIQPGDVTPRYTGVAKQRDLLTGIDITIDIDCLDVTDNLAIMSGPVIAAPAGIDLGVNMVFLVQDNGEGDNAPPDLFSRFKATKKGVGGSCSATKLVPPDIENQRGNIQVRGETASSCPVGYRMCCGRCEPDITACPEECAPK